MEIRREIRPGQVFKDNDPRMPYRYVRITGVRSDGYVEYEPCASNGHGTTHLTYKAKETRFYADGKPRKTGFSRVGASGPVGLGPMREALENARQFIACGLGEFPGKPALVAQMDAALAAAPEPPASGKPSRLLQAAIDTVEEYRGGSADGLGTCIGELEAAVGSVLAISRQPSHLTAAMDNVLASRLGQIANEAGRPRPVVGDSIDRGLILRRLLEEGGFGVVLLEPLSQNSQEAK
jgi:hypothetical protein